MTSCSSYVQSLRAYNGGNKLQHILFNAILNELSNEEQEILDQGLFEMQRGISRCNTSHVVDYVLLNSWIQDLPERDEQWKKQRVNEVIRHQSIRSTRSVISPEFSNLFSPKALFARQPSTKITSKIMKNRKHTRRAPDVFDQELCDAMDRLESLRSCGPEENTESYIVYIDAALNRAFGKNKEEKITSPVALLADAPPISPPDTESAMNIVCSSLTAKTTLEIDDDVHKHSQESLHKRTATADEVELRRISEARFRGIMSKAAKKYDIEEIIENLRDGTGHIPLNRIPLYTKAVKSLDDEKID